MTEHPDWPQGVDPMPAIAPSSDLFDGDILGDELIDIYNAAVVGGSDDNDEDMAEIPALLAHEPEPTKKENRALTPTATHSNAVPGAEDDGLGAFRPSTSFNDLTTLLPPTPSEIAPKTQQTPVANPVAVPSSVRVVQTSASTDSKKRSAEIQAANAAKRRATAAKKPQGSPTKSKVTKSSSVSSKSSSGKSKNTPNPLNITSSAVAHLKATGKAPTTKTTLRAPGVAAAPGGAAARGAQQVSQNPGEVDLSAPAPTEADFKSVAQAAVSNLIMNAGNKSESTKKGSADAAAGDEKIDTSTEHIKALTGTNWVSVCAGGDGGQNANANDKMNNRARRQNLTPDERARQNRDRNREHARNTRLRKKAYVEELKRTLTALVTQRDSNELEKRHTAQRELEQREVRFRVIEEFLKLRGRNEANFARWAAILEENFVLSLPLTDYRETASERRQFEQVIKGVSQAMADSNLFSSFLQSLSKGQVGRRAVTFGYSCDRKNFFMDNCTAVLEFTASSQGAVEQGAPSELVLKGNLKARFSPASNKLISVAMSFDTGIIMSQLNHVFKTPAELHNEVDAATAAAQVAASEADAILDSLQMPHIEPTVVPTNVTMLPRSVSVAVTDGEKSDSSDESNGDADEASKAVAIARPICAST